MVAPEGHADGLRVFSGRLFKKIPRGPILVSLKQQNFVEPIVKNRQQVLGAAPFGFPLKGAIAYSKSR